ncbi:acireductone dioxygenase [Pseudomonadota bacterium]
MSRLKVFSSRSTNVLNTVSDHDQIASELNAIGVRFERWQTGAVLTDSSSQEEIIAAYRSSIDALMNEYGFQSVDVIALGPDHPEREMLRKKFLDEHIHSDFEVRFFVDGKGLFYIHADEQVFGVMCEKGDLISVPAGAKHWFDMGEAPCFKCVRLFTTPEGWVADYTGNTIAKSFPTFETFIND